MSMETTNYSHKGDEFSRRNRILQTSLNGEEFSMETTSCSPKGAEFSMESTNWTSRNRIQYGVYKLDPKEQNSPQGTEFSTESTNWTQRSRIQHGIYKLDPKEQNSAWNLQTGPQGTEFSMESTNWTPRNRIQHGVYKLDPRGRIQHGVYKLNPKEQNSAWSLKTSSKGAEFSMESTNSERSRIQHESRTNPVRNEQNSAQKS